MNDPCGHLCLRLQDYVPQSQLVVPEHEVTRAKYPAIDAHLHLSLLGEQDENPEYRISSPEQLFAKLEQHNIRAVVDLDGYYRGRLERALTQYKSAHPGKVAVLVQLDWHVMDNHSWPDKLVKQLETALALGADGIKISKSLGLDIRDETGRLIPVDDPRLDALWETAARAGAPVLMHVADPVAFFSPVDHTNERWDELCSRPDWSWYGPSYPSFRELIDQLLNLLDRHRNTTFQLAHVGCYAENLAFVAKHILDPHPNVYTDISERIAELGRQPYTARKFMIEYQDRLLFGTDRPPLGPWYPYYFRFLETCDEYFPHGPEKPPRQGRWNIYGIGLPDEVLRKLYFENAERLYPTLRSS